jgi:hypothetical protein
MAQRGFLLKEAADPKNLSFLKKSRNIRKLERFSTYVTFKLEPFPISYLLLTR